MTPGRSTALVLVAVLGLACAPLPPLSANTCGNAVVERGESCDTWEDPTLGPGTECGACRYVCTAAMCPVGWGCSAVDGVCRAPSGVFEPVAGPKFPAVALDLRAVEVDGDGRLDLVGHSGVQIWTRFGDGVGGFSAETGFAIDVALSSLAYGDVNADTRGDVVLPVPSGFVTLVGDASRALQPITSMVYTAASSGGVLLLPMIFDPRFPFAGLVIMTATDSELAMRLNPFDGTVDGEPRYVFPDYHPVTEIASALVADLDPPALGRAQELVIAFRDEARVRVFRPDLTGEKPALALRAEIALPGPIGDVTILPADVNGDGVTDLVVPLALGVAVALGNGAGGFGAAIRDARFDALGAGPMPLAAADLDADGRTDYVDPWGVWLDRGGVLVQTAWNVTSAPWTLVTTADLDRDGVGDVAASTGGTRSLEVLRGSPLGFFSRVHVVTEGNVRVLRSGDFDGDRIDDLAIIEDGEREDALTVLFGATEGRTSAPVEMGTVPLVLRLEPSFIAVGPSTIDSTGDLFVQNAESADPAATQSLALFVGSTERRSLAPLNVGFDPYAIAVGDFSSDPDDRTDVLVFTEAVGVILAVGVGEGRFDQQGLVSVGPLGTPATFDPTSARFASADLDGDGRDELIALDHGAAFAGDLTPSALAVARVVRDGPTVMLDTQVVALADYLAPGNFSLADVDADGSLDLIVVFEGDVAAGTTDAGPPGAGVVVFWNENGAFDPARRRTVVPDLPGVRRYFAVTAVSGDVDAARELAIATDLGIFVIDAAPASRELVAAEEPFTTAFARALLAGDVTGDQLEDLIAYDGDDVTVHAAIPRAP